MQNYISTIHRLKYAAKLKKNEVIIKINKASFKLLHFFFKKGIIRFFFIFKKNFFKVFLKIYPAFYFFNYVKLFCLSKKANLTSLNMHYFYKQYGSFVLVLTKRGLMPLWQCMLYNIGGRVLCCLPF